MINKKKQYKATSPNGKTYTIEKMFKFCKEYNLNASCMFNVANGRRKHHKGWKVELIKDNNNETSKSNKGILQFTSWIRTNIKPIYISIRSWGKTN